MLSPVKVRAEHPDDRDAVHAVNVSAFETPFEAELVDHLRYRARPIVSLVAEVDRKVVGHIMFSPVTLTGHPDLNIMGLAPMAVSPAHQRMEVGSELVRRGLDECKRLGVSAVFVLGHPSYYPRFGFEKASMFGIDSTYEAPDEAFMAIELVPESLHERTGTVHFHPAFGND